MRSFSSRDFVDLWSVPFWMVQTNIPSDNEWIERDNEWIERATSPESGDTAADDDVYRGNVATFLRAKTHSTIRSINKLNASPVLQLTRIGFLLLLLSRKFVSSKSNVESSRTSQRRFIPKLTCSSHYRRRGRSPARSWSQSQRYGTSCYLWIFIWIPGGPSPSRHQVKSNVGADVPFLSRSKERSVIAWKVPYDYPLVDYQSQKWQGLRQAPVIFSY